MKNRVKRFLSLALAIVLVLSNVPAALAKEAEAAPALPTATVYEIQNEDLTFAMNFVANNVTEEQLAYYGNWYADFELTINKDVTFDANGTGDGYLSGQYDDWSENWVNVPFDEAVTLNANETIKIMAFAAELLGEPGLKYTYQEVFESVRDFKCGVYFTPEYLEANPDLEVTLELRMYDPADESKSYVIGRTYEFQNEFVARNTATEKLYETVAEAILAARDGETVALIRDVEEKMTSVLEDVTLDLNGYTLTTNYVTCFGDIIDSSEDNSGLLKVSDSRFLVQQSNAQLPVNSSEGYRFVEILKFNEKVKDGPKYVFQPLFEEDALALLKAGKDVTGVSVMVRVSWTQEQGTRTQNFEYNDTYVKQFVNSYNAATGKYGSQLTLTLTGAGSIEGLTFTAVVTSGVGVEFTSADEQEDTDGGETGNVTVKDNMVAEEVTISGDQASAVVPEGTLLQENTTNLTLTVQEMDESNSNITLGENEEKKSVDVHIEGIAADNTVPMLITINEFAEIGLNEGNLKLYHVENDLTVEMTRVYSLAEVDAHNEFYYDIATGTVTVALATFSEIALVSDTENHWNGAIDTRWADKTKTEFEIFNADQLAGLRYLVDNERITFKGTTITLMADIDLYGVDENGNRLNFEPIGFGYEFNGGQVFKGTFDGNGHTISNLYQNGWELGADTYSYSMAGGGLFASVVDATIKNLTMDRANIVMECVDMGVVVGYANGNCTFENIVVRNSTIENYNRATGGVIGEVGGGGNYTLNNVDVESTTTVSALWGTFDPSCGGIIGAVWGEAGTRAGKGTDVVVKMTDCDVAAKLDVYNDVTSAYQWYSYRRCGMLIGYTEESETINGRTEATAPFLTTENCTVQYGDWVNYHYCEFTDTTSMEARYPWVRVEAGLSHGAYSNARYGVPTFADGTKLDTSAAHIENKDCHNETDGHHELIVFNQLYGGGQGCYGGNQHLNNGVEVIGTIEPAEKFTAKKEENLRISTNVERKVTITLGELFEAIPDADIHDAGVHVYVSPATEHDTVRGSFVPSANTAWQDMPLTITGSGKAIVTISDYYYCNITSIEIEVISVEAAIISKTNPDMFFTDGEDIDLKLYIRKIDDLEEEFWGNLTITDASGSELFVYEARVEKATYFDKPLSEMIDLNELPATGIFTMQVLLTDRYGNVRINLTKTFYRAAQDGVAAQITSKTSPDMIFTEGEDIDLMLYVQKTDGVAEKFTATATIYDSEGNEIDTGSISTAQATTSIKTDISKLLNLTKLPATGTFTLNIVLTDSSNTPRVNLTKTFYRVASSAVAADITSVSNPDLVFTAGEEIDLVLRVKKNDGVAEAFKGVMTIYDSKGNKIVSNSGTFTKTTDLKANIAELVELTKLADPDTYTIKVELYDSSNTERVNLTKDFHIVTLGSATAEIASPSGADMYFTEGEAYDRVLHVVKTDGIAEDFTVTATVYNYADQKKVITGTTTLKKSADLTVAISNLLDLSQLPEPGTFLLRVVLTDNSGNERAKVEETFYRVKKNSVTATITSESNSDLIFTQGEEIDLVLTVEKNDEIPEVFNVTMTVTDSNGNEIDTASGTFNKSLSSAVTIRKQLELSKLQSGIFKINVVLTDSSNIERVNLTKDFAIVATNSATVAIGSTTDSDLVFTKGEAFDLQLQMTKNDTVPEDFTATVTVEGTEISGEINLDKGTKVTESISNLLDMSGLTAPGTYTIRVDLKDNADYNRATLTKTFYLVEKEGSVKTQISSSSNPDLIFTDADAKELKFYVQKTDGIGEQLHVQYSILDSSNTVVHSNGGDLSVNAEGYISRSIALPDLPYGTYTIHLTVKDSSDSDCIRSTSTLTFTRISGKSSEITCAIRNATGGTSLTYAPGTVKFTIYAQKADGVQETLTAAVAIKDSAGKTIYTNSATAAVPTSSNLSWPLTINNAPAGTYTLYFTLTDDAGNTRASYSVPLTINSK